MTFDANGLIDKVLPLINKSRTYLNTATNIISNINIPDDFPSASTLRTTVYNNINNVDSTLSIVKNWLNKKVDDMNEAERKNKEIFSEQQAFIYKTYKTNINQTGTVVATTVTETNNNLNSTGATTAKKTESIFTKMGKGFDKFIDSIKNIGATIFKHTKSVISSICNVITSLLKGIAQFIETLLDLIVLIGTGVASIFTGLFDAIQAINGAITGEEWSSATKGMWSGVMGYVAEDHVGNTVANFYKKNTFGKWLDDNAYAPFKSDGVGCQIASGLGYVAGIIALTVATAGIGTVAVSTAGASVGITVSATAATAITSGIVIGSITFSSTTAQTWASQRDKSWEGIEKSFQNGEINLETYESFKQINNMSDEEWLEIENAYKRGNITEEDYNSIKSIKEIPTQWKTTDNLFSGFKKGALEGGKATVITVATMGIGSKVAGFVNSKVPSIFSKLPRDGNGLFSKLINNFIEESSETAIEFGSELATTRSIKGAYENTGGWIGIAASFGLGFLLDLDLQKKIKKVPIDADGVNNINKKSIKIDLPEEYDLIFSSNEYISKKYKKIADNLMIEASDMPTDIQEKMFSILTEGKYEGFTLKSDLMNKNNANYEATKRLQLATLLKKDPVAFNAIYKNNINLYHGTNSNALESILRNGMHSEASSLKNGLTVSTGEFSFQPREFISFTDDIGLALGYSTLSPTKNAVNDLSYSVLIGTSVDDLSEIPKVRISSDLPEVGIMNSLPIKKIKVLAVPESQVKEVQQLLNKYGQNHIQVIKSEGIALSTNSAAHLDPNNNLIVRPEELIIKSKSSKQNKDYLADGSEAAIFNADKWFQKKAVLDLPIKTELSDNQIKVIKQINSMIKNNESVRINYKNTTEISSSMLSEISDLSKVKFVIADGLGDQNGNLKSKYHSQKYYDRISYTGNELKPIINCLENIQSRIDMNLPIPARAEQVYNILASKLWMRDVSTDAMTKVSQSLRGITDNNIVGKQGLICAGYASAFKEICDRVGIQADYVRGNAIVDINTGKGGKHAWNVVITDEGVIPVDVTWKATGGGEWFGPSEKFASTHIADSVEEVYKVYDQPIHPISQKLQYNNTNNRIKNIKSIITIHEQNYPGQGIISLKKVLNAGNYNSITRTGNARAALQQIPILDIEEYVNIHDSINFAISNHDAKYGYGTGYKAIQALIEEGNYNRITSSNGARSRIKNFSVSDLKQFMDTN